MTKVVFVGRISSGFLMIKVVILTVGKNKESWLSSALSLYETRLKGKVSFKFIILKDEKKLSEQIKELNPIILDLSGKSFSSQEFSSFFVANIKQNGAKIYFAIGGAKGFLNTDLSTHKKISLSSLTLTHQMVRLLLVEQIYRAYTLWQGFPYHK